jgi:hypothetical protein
MSLGQYRETLKQDWVTGDIAIEVKVICLIPQRINLDRQIFACG